MLDLPPAFPLPKQWEHPMASRTPEVDSQIQNVVRLFRAYINDPWNMISFYTDLATLCFATFEPSPETHNVPESILTGAWVNPFIHRMLSWRPELLVPGQQGMEQEIFRIGVWLFLTPVWRYFGVAPVISHFVLRKLRAVMQRQTLGGHHTGSDKIRRWALYMAACEEVLRSSDDDWFCRQLASRLAGGDAVSWSELVEDVKEILWLEPLFGVRDAEVKCAVLESMGRIEHL
jgi:hypothetical protein